jgi:hypothetical protein
VLTDFWILVSHSKCLLSYLTCYIICLWFLLFWFWSSCLEKKRQNVK